MKFLSTTHTPRFNFAVLLVHFADLHVDLLNNFWTRLTMKWPWREHEVARGLYITITFFSCLVVFGDFAFLLASAQVMNTSHRLVTEWQTRDEMTYTVMGWRVNKVQPKIRKNPKWLTSDLMYNTIQYNGTIHYTTYLHIISINVITIITQSTLNA